MLIGELKNLTTQNDFISDASSSQYYGDISSVANFQEPSQKEVSEDDDYYVEFKSFKNKKPLKTTKAI